MHQHCPLPAKIPRVKSPHQPFIHLLPICIVLTPPRPPARTNPRSCPSLRGTRYLYTTPLFIVSLDSTRFRLHHAKPLTVTCQGSGIATCLNRVTGTAGLAPAGLRPCRLLLSHFPPSYLLQLAVTRLAVRAFRPSIRGHPITGRNFGRDSRVEVRPALKRNSPQTTRAWLVDAHWTLLIG